MASHLEPQRDRWGRPLLVPPDGGKRQPYTRTTTIADTCDERRALEAWLQRRVAIGLSRRADLYTLAVAADPDDKAALDEVCEQAKAAAAAGARANLGTALHRLTERADRGEEVRAPEPFAADLDAYRRATEAIEWVLIERLVVLDALRIAGTPDRIGRLPDGRLVIADLKTGTDLQWSWRSIAVQLAGYAHGDALYDVSDDTRSPMPSVDLAEAVVIHLPAGEGRCELLTVDVAAGWKALQLALEVRAWRQRRDLHRPFALEAAELADPVEVEEHRRRVLALRAEAKAVVGALVAEAADAGVDFRPSVAPTERRLAVHRAAVAVAEVLDGDDEVTRTAITLITGTEPQASLPLGAVVGSLTTAEALRLTALLVELGAGERCLRFTDTGAATFPPTAA